MPHTPKSSQNFRNHYSLIISNITGADATLEKHNDAKIPDNHVTQS